MVSKNNMTKFEQKVVSYADWVIKRRWVAIITTLIVVAIAGSGARFIQFDNDYQIFFGEDNP